MDIKIRMFFDKLSEHERVERLFNVRPVPNTVNREEWNGKVIVDGTVGQVFIWKNPDNTYGWSDLPDGIRMTNWS